MCKLSARYYIALLTFLIGVSFVAIWFQYRDLKADQPAENVPLQSVTNVQETTRPLADNSAENSEELQIWRIDSISPYAIRASVMSFGKAHNGENIRTILNIQCPNEESNFSAISFIVDLEQPGFDYDSFKVPGASAAEQTLGEIRAVSPQKNLTIKTKIGGGYYPDGGFAFDIRSDKLARLIAKGSTEVTIITHDYKDYKKTIQTTFSAIKPTSEIARTLKGCHK